MVLFPGDLTKYEEATSSMEKVTSQLAHNVDRDSSIFCFFFSRVMTPPSGSVEAVEGGIPTIHSYPQT